jgi:hypothetical protein
MPSEPPAPDAQRINNRFRPSRSPRPVKQLRFPTDKDAAMCHQLEALAQLKRVRMNDFLLQVLRHGLAHLHAPAEARADDHP